MGPSGGVRHLEGLIDFGQPILVDSGYQKKIYTRRIDGFVYRSHEADWTFRDSIRYSRSRREAMNCRESQ